MLYLLTLAYLGLLILRPQEFLPALRDAPVLVSVQGLMLAAWLFAKDKALRLPHTVLSAWLMVAIALSVGFSGWWGGVTAAITAMVPAVLMMVIVWAAVRDVRQLRGVMWLVVACASVMVLHGHWQLADGIGWTGKAPLLGRITYAGIFSDPNDLGQLFVVSIAFCAYFFHTGGGLTKFMMIACAGWLGYGILLTDSRGTMLGALVVIGLEGWRRYGKVVIGIAAAAAIPVLIVTTRLGAVSAKEESAAGRVDAWYAGIKMWQDHPLFGVGYGNFLDHHILTAHNSIILPMAELGLFGFIPWFGFLWFSVIMIRWCVQRPGMALAVNLSPGQVAAELEAARGVMTASIGFTVTAFFLSRSYAALFFLMLGIIAGRFVHMGAVFGDAPALSLFKSLPKIAAAAVGCMAFMWFAVKFLI